jgi:hypothetical protein
MVQEYSQKQKIFMINVQKQILKTKFSADKHKTKMQELENYLDSLGSGFPANS